MDVEKIKKWIANIEHFEPDLSLGTCRTLGDIKKELDKSSQFEPQVKVQIAEITEDYIEIAFNKIVTVTDSKDFFERDGFAECNKVQLHAIIMQIWLHSNLST